MKTVIITGASGGIGTATAMEFAKHKYNIIFNYYSGKLSAESSCKLIESKYNTKCLPYYADISNETQVTDMINFAYTEFGSIDVLVNNAGIARQKLFTDITLDDWNKMIAVNLTGVFLASKYALKYMINQKSGSIVNVSSVWGETGGACEADYSAAKAGVIGLTKALAKEEGLSNIRINCVSPGVINTKMNSNLTEDDIRQITYDTPLNCIGKPEDVAKTIYFLASDATFITGQVLGVNGGYFI